MANHGKPTKDKSGYYTQYLKLKNGKYKRIYGTTARECQKKYDEAYKKYVRDEYVEPHKETYEHWVKLWERDYTINTKDATKKTYHDVLKARILPFFEGVKVQSISQQKVQRWISEITQKCSPATVRLAFTVFNRTMNDAKAAGIIARNPCDNTKLPKKEKKEIEPLSKSEIPLFLKTSRSMYPYLTNIYEFMLLTGLRVGELIGLTFDRYDPFDKTIKIDRQLSSVTHEFSTPKSNKARTLKLPERAVELIREQKKWIQSEREDEPNFNEGDFIFPDLNGKVLTKDKLYTRFKRVAKEYGKPNLRLHDLRHTYATLLISLGVDVKTVQENLGHTNPAFTLDKYAHSTREMQEIASRKINELF